MGRAKKLLVALGLIGLAWGALAFLIPQIAPYRTARWLVASTSSLGALFARIARSDSGLLKNQLTTRLLLLEPWMVSLQHRAQGLALSDDYQAINEFFLQEDHRYDFKIDGDGLQARLQLFTDAPCAPAAPLQGFIRFSTDIRDLSGWGVVVETQVTGRVENQALYVLDRELTVAIDPLSVQCPAYYQWKETFWQGEAPMIPKGERFSVELGDLRLTVQVLAGEVLESFPHLLAPERLISQLLRFPPPTLGMARASVRVEGTSGDHSGVLLTRQ
jgi:hypothetical protein